MTAQQSLKIALRLAQVARTESESKVYVDLAARISARIDSPKHTKQFSYLVFYLAVMLLVVVVL